MIPREILKKIRQIEIRTNRVVTEFAERGQFRRTGVAPVSNSKTAALAESAATATPSFQTAGKILEDGDRRDACPTPRTRRSSPAISKAFASHHALRLGLRPQPRSVYFRRSANRFSILATTSSIGVPRPGFFSASSARRSSSSICSGVSSGSYPFSTMLLQTCCASSRRSARLNLASTSAFKVFQGNFPIGIGGDFQSWKPSMNSSQRRCASSTRSSNGSFFAAEKNFATDMDSIYSVDLPAQAGFSRRANSSFVIRHLSLFNA